MRFDGTAHYVASDELKLAFNAAITLQRPLLIKGEPGTGKTLLAEEMAGALAAPLFTWHVKSTTKAHPGMYEYDAVSRLRDSHTGYELVHDVRNYIRHRPYRPAICTKPRAELTLDEIAKADKESP